MEALGLAFYAGLVAAFELNNMTIQVDSPLLAACQALNKMSGPVKVEAGKVMQHKVQQALRLKKAYESGEGEEEAEGAKLVATLREMRLMGGRAFEPLEGSPEQSPKRLAPALALALARLLRLNILPPFFCFWQERRCFRASAR